MTAGCFVIPYFDCSRYSTAIHCRTLMRLFDKVLLNPTSYGDSFSIFSETYKIAFYILYRWIILEQKTSTTFKCFIVLQDQFGLVKVERKDTWLLRNLNLFILVRITKYKTYFKHKDENIFIMRLIGNYSNGLSFRIVSFIRNTWEVENSYGCVGFEYGTSGEMVYNISSV